MKATATRKGLHAAAKAAAGTSDPRNPIPFYAQALVTIGAGRITVAATDGSVSSSVSIEAKTSGKQTESIAVDAKVLAEAVSLSGGDDVTIETGDNSRVSIWSGKSKIAIASTAGKDYPSMGATPDGTPLRVSASALATAIRKVAFVADGASLAGALAAAVRLSCDGKSVSAHSLVSHRVAHCSFESACATFPETPVSRKGADRIAAMLDSVEGDVDMIVGKDSVTVRSSSSSVTARTVIASPLEWRRLLSAAGQRVAVNAVELGDAVSRAAMFSTRDHENVTLAVSGNAMKVSRSGASGEASSDIELAAAFDDSEIKINGRYLKDALAVIDSPTVEIQLSGKLAPAVIRPVGDKSEQILIIAAMDNS